MMSSVSPVNVPPTLGIAQMLLEDLTSLASAEIYATDASNLETFEDIIAASYTTTRALINATQPINRFPPEILTKIFFLVPSPLVYRQRYMELPIDFMFDVRDLRPLILTCRHWRTLITSTPSLWSTILDVWDRWRSRSMPSYYLQYALGDGDLDLYISAGRDVGNASQEVLDICRRTATASRVRGIFIDCGRSCSGECSMILHSAFPNLEYCCINTLSCRSIIAAPQANRRRSILPQSPKLNTLILNVWSDVRGGVFPETGPFPALTTLYINELNYKRDCAALLRFLGANPYLQKLVLQTPSFGPAKEVGFVGRHPLHHLRMLQVSCPEVDSVLVQSRMPLPWQVTIVAGLCQLLSHISLTPASWVDGIELMNIPLNALRAVLEEVDASGGTDFVSVTTANLEREEEAIETQSTFPSDTEEEGLPKFSITLRCANACRIKLTFLAYKETKATSHAHDTTTDDQSLAQHLTAEQDTCAHLCGLFAATSMFSGLRGLWLSDATWLTCVPPHNVLQFLPQLTMLVVDRARDESLNSYCPSTTEAYNPRSILEGLKKGPDLTAPCPLLHTLAIFCGNDSPESDSDYTAAGILAEVQEVVRSRAEEGCPLACVVAIRGDEMLQATEYEYQVGCEEGLELVREYEGLVVVYQELKAKWEHLTH